jgi:hypothetical protein
MIESGVILIGTEALSSNTGGPVERLELGRSLEIVRRMLEKMDLMEDVTLTGAFPDFLTGHDDIPMKYS